MRVNGGGHWLRGELTHELSWTAKDPGWGLWTWSVGSSYSCQIFRSSSFDSLRSLACHWSLTNPAFDVPTHQA